MKQLPLAVAALGGLGLAAAPAGAGQDFRAVARPAVVARTATRSRPGELIVRFREGADERTVERALREVGARIARRAMRGSHYRVTLAEDASTLEAVRQLTQLPEVDYAEPNFMVHKLQGASFTPNDRFFDVQWNFKLIGATRTWAIQKGSTQVAIAVVDTGIAYEDFGPFRKAPDWGGMSFLPGFNALSGDSHANDDEGHGTHVASTIAEATNNSEGMAGLAFGCSLMPVKVLDAQGLADVFTVAEGIDYVTNFRQGGANPVKVINLSLGGPDPSETLRRAVDRAVAAGIVVVAAAGNDSRNGVDYPAAEASVMAVGAVDGRKQRAFYSNFGSKISVVAPGGDVDRDDDNDGHFDAVYQQTLDFDFTPLGRYDQFCYCGFDGTSSASPHVAALAALLISQGITSPAAVRAAIEQTAEDLGAPGRDDQFGHGLIAPAKALSGLGLNK